MSFESYKKSFYFGIFCCPIGLIIGLYIKYTSVGDYSEFPYYSTLAAFIMPAISWGLFVERNKQTSSILTFF